MQQFVPADAAGVLFTANPLDGERGQIVINATWAAIADLDPGAAVLAGTVTQTNSTIPVITLTLSKHAKSLSLFFITMTLVIRSILQVS